MFKISVLWFVLLTTSISFAQGPAMSVKTQLDVQKIQDYAHLIQKDNPQMLDAYPLVKINGEYYVSFLGRTSGAAPLIPTDGIVYGGHTGDIRSVRVRLDKLAELGSTVGLQNLELAGKIKPSLDKVVFDTRVDSVHAGLNLPQGYSGKNVMIGITDWGFDYSSPMFYDTALQNTRIYAAWDQFKTSGPAPSGYNYGTEYTTSAQFIAAGADTANIYSYATHGSHVAGIAGGSGAGLKYRGMAFEAEFLFTTFLVDEAAVLDAWQWMYDIADGQGKRLVMNMSWGLYHFGTNDGNSLMSQAISDYSDLGVVFVTSAGNNGNVDFHIKKEFLNDSIATRVNFYNYNANANMWGQSIHAWGEVGEAFELKLEMWNNTNQTVNQTVYFPTSLNAYVDTFMVSGNDTVWYNIAIESAHPLNNRPTARLRVKNMSSAIKILLKAKSNAGIVHFWNVTELVTDVGNWGMPFSILGANAVAGDPFYGIGEPAASDDCISVAAHAASFLQSNGATAGGGRASFSSIGPRYDEVLKPDISAPGVNVRSSISSYTDNGFSQIASVTFNGRTYPFAAFSGTSMSSPAVAGICALILEANPYLSPQQVKTIIIQTRRLDSFTGVIDANGDHSWGHGKINAYAAIQLALQTVGMTEVTTDLNWTVYPNPTTEGLKISGIKQLEKLREGDVISAGGQLHKVQITDGEIDLVGISPGTYVLRLVVEGKVIQQKFVKQ